MCRTSGCSSFSYSLIILPTDGSTAAWNMTKKLMSPFHLFVRPEARTILKWFLGKSKDSGKSTGTHGLLLWYGEDGYISISNEVLYVQGSDRFANLPPEGSTVAWNMTKKVDVSFSSFCAARGPYNFKVVIG